MKSKSKADRNKYFNISNTGPQKHAEKNWTKFIRFLWWKSDYTDRLNTYLNVLIAEILRFLFY